jgi:hypothetical protein
VCAGLGYPGLAVKNNIVKNNIRNYFELSCMNHEFLVKCIGYPGIAVKNRGTEEVSQTSIHNIFKSRAVI